MLLPNDLGEVVHAWTHRSGLRVRVVEKPGFEEIHGALMVRFGSCDVRFEDRDGELDLPPGFAHFLEHQMFEDERGDVAARFARLGASSNAATSFRTTSFTFETSTALDACLDLLFELVTKPWFTAESVAKERAVIAREIAMYDDEPGTRQFQALLGALYREHPIRIPIAGTRASIEAIDAALLHRVYSTAYRPGRLALCVVGAVDPERVRARVDAAFDHFTAALPASAGDTAPPAEDDAPNARDVRVRHAVTRPRWALGFKDRRVPRVGRELVEHELATTLLLDCAVAPSSQAHHDWLRLGVIDDTFGCDYTLEPGVGFATFGGEIDRVPPPGVAPEVELALCTELARIVRDGLDPADFERSRRKQLGRFVSYFDELGSLATSFAEGALLDISPFDWLVALRTMERGRVERRAVDLFAESHASRSILIPSGEVVE